MNLLIFAIVWIAFLASACGTEGLSGSNGQAPSGKKSPTTSSTQGSTSDAPAGTSAPGTHGSADAKTTQDSGTDNQSDAPPTKKGGQAQDDGGFGPNTDAIGQYVGPGFKKGAGGGGVGGGGNAGGGFGTGAITVAFAALEPTPAWVCGSYPTTDPHGVQLTPGFSPSYAKGYRLSLRPDLGQCTGLAVKLVLTGVKSGTSITVACSGANCADGGFQVGLKTRDSWTLSPADLAGLGETGDTAFTMGLTWVGNVDAAASTCYQASRAAYGLAFALTRGDDLAPDSGIPACHPAPPDQGFDLSP